MKKQQYKTPLKDRLRVKSRRDAIKVAGGAEYEDYLARERARRAAYRAKYPDKLREERRAWEKVRKRKRGSHRGDMRRRKVYERLRDARKRGIEVTITFDDIYWPSHCPVLGLELDYATKRGKRCARNPANPSLDRWDNTKGYVPGNVYVISYRANVLKNNATPTELASVAAYARHGPSSSTPLFAPSALP